MTTQSPGTWQAPSLRCGWEPPFLVHVTEGQPCGFAEQPSALLLPHPGWVDLGSGQIHAQRDGRRQSQCLRRAGHGHGAITNTDPGLHSCQSKGSGGSILPACLAPDFSFPLFWRSLAPCSGLHGRKYISNVCCCQRPWHGEERFRKKSCCEAQQIISMKSAKQNHWQGYWL